MNDRLRIAAKRIAEDFAAKHGASVREDGRRFVGKMLDGREFAVSW